MLRRVHTTIVAMERQYSEGVFVASWACAILSSVACPALQYSSTFSRKRHDFRIKNLFYIKCVFRVSLRRFCVRFFILRRIERDTTDNVYWSSCEVPFVLVRFEWNWIVLVRFSKNTGLSNLVTIRPIRAGLLHACGRTSQTWRS